ncbi:MAG: cytochrome c [Thiohalocapsa sp.]|jgi:mono/diheme cytochrome c family protein|uniref:c-type cytochrome n=1 Tax=Thiohalocapsa sp. TaxID=2497641 RepID=UPI0025DD075D|nr:c-type cytochrome [Thiohalocapsa sp.]MCG6942949.1 cytochrome c [Thiohalocapsa sp.]
MRAHNTLRFALVCGGLLAALASADDGLTPAKNYQLRCSGCHTMQGAGHPEQGVPDFRGMVGSFASTEGGRKYLLHVPGVIASSLSDREIAEVLNLIMQRWAGESLPAHYDPFTAAEVTRLRAAPIGNLVKYRRAVAKDLRAKDLPVAAYPWP